ncbi:MAG: 30S ribosomal protein S17 [Candidatus Taylorbacteria bacterium RIFCSPLOWO2_01_FULL_44_26]|uniref:30S ribosomal protein S17 n=2 Tax=Candidatus Tayloriibacteriota TaxID=1817919 RepID=A0A1G2ML41_9BACT|nr:MAG: 30S ribosomal protein S17 [Candidatus Taylorbacteria bacterium RIFCSPHIGHO2_02_FULL_44_12]OHA31105.1 MAG: 30S ribosomal protein S17 [Candidatus Taylorbacteria bacterium RIFCSPLOWO2_01_FULL_44_26]
MKEQDTTEPQVAKKRQTFSGIVVSDKMKDTSVVIIERHIKHPVYQKFMTRKTRIMAHDPGNTKKIGEKAIIEACRPISKHKAFKVIV